MMDSLERLNFVIICQWFLRDFVLKQNVQFWIKMGRRLSTDNRQTFVLQGKNCRDGFTWCNFNFVTKISPTDV